LVELAPVRERGSCLLIDAHTAAGDVGSALEAYESCRVALRDALGVGPSPMIRDRHAALLATAA
jgi:DNA-binding SARP family transcriptional activator